MRLVGATNWFIRWPFMVEGVVVGFIGGLIAVCVLWLGKLTIVDPLADDFALRQGPADDRLPAARDRASSAPRWLVSAIGSGHHAAPLPHASEPPHSGSL